MPGTTSDAQTTKDPAAGRTFPCAKCGAALVFHIGEQELKCPYCGATRALNLPSGHPVEERDLPAMLRQVAAWKSEGAQALGSEEIRCEACGARTTFHGTMVSQSCAYCGAPLQRDKAVTAPKRIPVDGVIPFAVERESAAANLKAWVRSRWFAPNEFLRRGVQGDFQGAYLPFFSYDAMTFTRFSGERGTVHTREVGSGQDRHTETYTTWMPVSGSFQRFFDDVMVCAATGLPEEVMNRLEPWPIERAVPFTPDVLAGYVAQSYETGLEEGFEDAKGRIEHALDADVRTRIGGDEQRVSSMQVDWSALTYKHLLLPCWVLAYRFHQKSYRVVVNAATGEVQGERPWSAVKIALAVLAALALVALFLWAKQNGSS